MSWLFSTSLVQPLCVGPLVWVTIGLLLNCYSSLQPGLADSLLVTLSSVFQKKEQERLSSKFLSDYAIHCQLLPITFPIKSQCLLLVFRALYESWPANPSVLFLLLLLLVCDSCHCLSLPVDSSTLSSLICRPSSLIDFTPMPPLLTVLITAVPPPTSLISLYFNLSFKLKYNLSHICTL